MVSALSNFLKSKSDTNNSRLLDQVITFISIATSLWIVNSSVIFLITGNHSIAYGYPISCLILSIVASGTLPNLNRSLRLTSLTFTFILTIFFIISFSRIQSIHYSISSLTWLSYLAVAFGSLASMISVWSSKKTAYLMLISLTLAGVFCFGYGLAYLSIFYENKLLKTENVSIYIGSFICFLLITCYSIIIIALDLQKKKSEIISHLKQKFDTLSNIADNSPSVVYRFQIKPFYKLEYVNKSLELMSGYLREEHYEDPNMMSKLIHPDDQKLFDQIDDFSKPTFVRWIKKSGEIIWAEHHHKPIFENGEIQAMEGAIIDITERKKSEEALEEYRKNLEKRIAERTNQLESVNNRLNSTNKKLVISNEKLEHKNYQLSKEILRREALRIDLVDSEAKFRSFIQQSTDGIALVDKSGKVIQWNRAMENIFELKKEDVLDYYIWDVEEKALPKSEEEQKQLQSLKTEIDQLLKEDNDNKISIQHECTIFTSSNKTKNLLVSVFEIKLLKDSFFGVITWDITELKTKEKELDSYKNHLETLVDQRSHDLKKSEAKFSTIFKLNRSIIALMDLQSSAIIDMNEISLSTFGYQREQVIGRSPIELGLFSNEEVKEAFWDQLISKGKFETDEAVLYNKAGQEVFCSIYGEKVELDGKEAALIQAHNITDIKLAEKNILEKNQSLIIAEEELLATIEEHQATNDSLAFKNKELERANFDLRSNEEKYRILFENGHDAVILMQGSSFYDCNTKAEQMYGVGKVVFNVKNPFLFSPTHQPDGSLSSEKALKILNGDQPGVFEWMHQKLDGTLFECKITVSYFLFNDKKYSQMVIRDVTEKKIAEHELFRKNQLINNIKEGISSKIGKLFFETVTTQIAKALECDYAFAGELFIDEKNEKLIKTISFWKEGELTENIIYKLKGSPCEIVIHGTSCSYTSNVASKFPKDIGLREMGVESYVGMPLHNDTGETIGIIVAMWKQKMPDEYLASQLLEIFSGRAGVELQKLKSDSALLESEDRFRNTFEKVAVGIAHISNKGQFIRVNQRLCEIVGYTQEELLRLKFMDIAHPDDIEFYKNLTDRFIKKEIKDITSQKRFNHKSGNEIWVNITSSYWYNPDGSPKHGLTVIEDITQRKNTELELEGYKNKLEELVVERTNEIRNLNKELTYKNDKLGEYNEGLLMQKKELEDILEKLKNTQSQLVQSEKMASLGVLTAGIAHEINNPVNFISSGLEALKIALKNILIIIEKYNKLDPSEFSKQLDEIQELKKTLRFDFLKNSLSKITKNMEKGVSRTSDIVRGLRTFSHPDVGKAIPTNIHDNIDSALTILHHQFKNSVQVEKDYGNIENISCHPGELNQVFINIIGNAIDALKDKQRRIDDFNPRLLITTGLAEDTKYVLIRIIDNADGIEKNIVNKIFEPFYTTKPVGKGTGLGLSISYSIIQKHNGKIEVKSKEGKGSEFVITLPIF